MAFTSGPTIFTQSLTQQQMLNQSQAAQYNQAQQSAQNQLINQLGAVQTHQNMTRLESIEVQNARRALQEAIKREEENKFLEMLGAASDLDVIIDARKNYLMLLRLTFGDKL